MSAFICSVFYIKRTNNEHLQDRKVHNGTKYFYQRAISLFGECCLHDYRYMFLNSVVIVTLKRSTQLRKKPCYFFIIVLCCCDLRDGKDRKRFKLNDFVGSKVALVPWPSVAKSLHQLPFTFKVVLSNLGRVSLMQFVPNPDVT